METTLRKAGEDYLEAIFKLEDANPNVRSIDVAAELGVSRPSVSKALGVLKKAGMIEQQPYGRISLTALGRAKALEVARRHRLLRRFLIDLLGVDPQTADEDACRMEHVVSQQTMRGLTAYLSKQLERG